MNGLQNINFLWKKIGLNKFFQLNLKIQKKKIGLIDFIRVNVK